MVFTIEELFNMVINSNSHKDLDSIGMHVAQKDYSYSIKDMQRLNRFWRSSYKRITKSGILPFNIGIFDPKKVSFVCLDGVIFYN